jgi:hypothetical protein
VNTLQQTDGRKPDQQLPLQKALAGISNDPAVGGILQFRIVSQVPSVDVPGVILHATDPDRSVVPNVLTEQIPIVTPVRERVVQWGDPAVATRAGPMVNASLIVRTAHRFRGASS